MKKFPLIALAFATFAAIRVNADVTLPHIFSDNMVLQRGQRVPVWGWATPGERVTVEFAGEKKSATADKSGKWEL